MFSVISFLNVMMAVKGSASYAALGVGLAMVMSLGLTAVTWIGQPMATEMMADEQQEMKAAVPAPEMPESEEAFSAAQSTAPPEPPAESLMQEERYLAVEAPAAYGWLSFMPYVAAGIVASAVFVVIRKRERF